MRRQLLLQKMGTGNGVVERLRARTQAVANPCLRSLRYRVLRLMPSASAVRLTFQRCRSSCCCSTLRSALSRATRPGMSSAATASPLTRHGPLSASTIVGDADHAIGAQHRGGAQHIAQLPQVARPGVAEQLVQRVFADAHVVLAALLAQQGADQFGLVAALAQRRQVQHHAIEAVVQVLTELAGGHHLHQVAVAGADHVQFQRHRPVAARGGGTLCSSSTRSSRVCSGMSPISSRNRVPPLACSSLPWRPSRAASVNAPRA